MGRPASKVLAALLLFSAALVASPAQAQVAVFQPSDYGKTNLPLRESLGPNVGRIEKERNVFEPIGRLAENDPLRAASRAIGRLDVLTRSGELESISVCTASIVGKNLALTNYHCIPGFGGKVEKASILIDYLEKDAPEAIRLAVSPEPIAADQKLDYALLRVLDPVPAELKPLEFQPRQTSSRDRLVIVHHPAGQVKVMTQFQCFVHEKPSSQPEFVRHVCDTLGGSSGGILFDASLAPVALHHTGGLNENDPASFNEATTLLAIVQRHPDLLPSAGTSAETAADPDPKPKDGPDLNRLIGQ